MHSVCVRLVRCLFILHGSISILYVYGFIRLYTTRVVAHFTDHAPQSYPQSAPARLLPTVVRTLLLYRR